MKIRYFIAIGFMAVVLSSCGARFNNAEDLTVPILQAIKSDNIGKLKCMLPPENKTNELFAADKGTLGWVYYNKYNQSYHEMQLEARLRTNLDIIKTITDENKLDWDNVEYSKPKKDDVTDSLSSYSIVTTDLKFPSGTYTLSYHAAVVNGKWYLLDDLYFTTKQVASN